MRRALVTGAAAGIGAAIAERLRLDGFEVTTLDRSEGCDLTVDLRTDDLPALADLDVCVANAAITDTIASAHRMTPEQWGRDIEVNLTGAFRTVQACLPGMRERGWGRVVAISSGAAKSGLRGQVAYSASKAGLLGMVKTIAAENAHRGITANAVLPGMVATEKVRAMPQEILDRLAPQLPSGRMVEPAEIAAAVSFLCSGEAAQVTGQELAVDGGAALNTFTLGSQRPD
ncbi:MAG TPA: SDR family NAD(P)-dependent oxidoreductase [Solirubrobacterales bacterium]|nr:SDR family NAD(P)-dependent oxidoreductase [Solirubrobacterales bacterium]